MTSSKLIRAGGHDRSHSIIFEQIPKQGCADRASIRDTHSHLGCLARWMESTWMGDTRRSIGYKAYLALTRRDTLVKIHPSVQVLG
jgi:hypothetical protein